MATLIALFGDITIQPVDVVVNAANNKLAGGGGVDGAIHRAGGPVIAEECQQWTTRHGSLPTGAAMATSAGAMQARWVVHTVGPIWGGIDNSEADRLLGLAYRSSLDAAGELGAKSVAFPNISTGVYGFPKPRAALLAIGSVRQWLDDGHAHIEEIRFVCFDEENHQLYLDNLRNLSD